MYEVAAPGRVSQGRTMQIKMCFSCEAPLLEHDRFCRRCGTNQTAVIQVEGEAASTLSLTPVCAHRSVSDPLVGEASQLAARAMDLLCNPLLRGVVLMLIAAPVWLMIVLLSPLDAFMAARRITRDPACE